MTTDTDLARRVAWLEQVLPVGYSITRTHSGVWYLKCWTSYLNFGVPRLGWRDVDSDRSLSALLERMPVSEAAGSAQEGG